MQFVNPKEKLFIGKDYGSKPHMGRLKIVGYVGKREDPKISGFVLGKKEYLEELGIPKEKAIDISMVLKDIKATLREILKKDDATVLVSGDPLFFSIGEKLVEEFKNCTVVPEISYMQIAFSRIKKPWKDALFLSLHGRDIKNILTALSQEKRFVFVFTDKKNNPREIAKFLVHNDVKDLKFYVFEKLNRKDERIVECSIEKASKEDFGQPNCLIIEKEKTYPDPLQDELYQKKKGIFTKSHIRSLLLSLIGLKRKKIVWDVGAGSGAVSIFLSKFSHLVYAIEKNEDNLDIIKENRRRFGAWNVIPIKAEAPGIFQQLDKPEVIFVGTGAKNNVIEKAYEMLSPSGTLVATAVTPESIENFFRLKRKFKGELISVHTTFYKNKLPDVRAPVWILKIQKFI